MLETNNKSYSKDSSVFHHHYIGNRLIKIHLEQFRNYFTGRILDLGCGERPYEKLFSEKAAAYYSVDSTVNEWVRPHIVSTGSQLPFQDSVFDTVVATEVLEHVAEPEEVLREANRILKKDGCLIITVPQAWALHDAPYDFYRYTRFGITHLLEKTGFEILEICARGGTGSVMGQVFNNFLHHVFGEKISPPLDFNKRLHNLCHKLYPCLIPVSAGIARFLDRFDKKQLEVLGHSVVAKK